MAKARDGGSTSNSALKRALSTARRRNRHEPSEKRGFSRTISRKRSTSKRKAWKDKLYSRCAPSIVVDVIEDLHKQQIELVKEMHFHGFVSLKLHKLNKPFAAWLLSKFDTTSSQFFSGTNRVIKLTSEDICYVIGLSCTGKPIVHWDTEDHMYLFNDISIPFDVTQCRLIFVPLNLPYHYVLYAFDMEKKIIYILDPIRNPNKGGQDIAARHSKTKYQIAKSLKECMKLAFPAWEEDIPSWHHEFSTNILATDNCMDSDFHVLHFMKNWDGNRLVNQASNDSRELRKAFLPNLLSFENNEVILPDAVSRYLQAIKRN